MSAGKFIAGFVVGGAIGAIAGILLAPKSGAETRDDIANTKDKRKTVWRKLFGSWNKSAEREAGKKAVEAGNNLLDQVETVKASEKEITKKTKKYNMFYRNFSLFFNLQACLFQ